MEHMETVKNFAPHMDDLTLEELEEIVRKDAKKEEKSTTITWDSEGNRIVNGVKQPDEKPPVQ